MLSLLSAAGFYALFTEIGVDTAVGCAPFVSGTSLENTAIDYLDQYSMYGFVAWIYSRDRLSVVVTVVRYYPLLWLIILYALTRTAFNRTRAEVMGKHYELLNEVLSGAGEIE